MEKLVYALWKPADEPDQAFSKRLLGPIRKRLVKLGAHRLQLNVTDNAVADGEPLRQKNLRPSPVALVSFWLNSAHIRAAFEAVLREAAPQIAGYAVSESTVLPDTETTADGSRCRGFSQVAVIAIPPRLTREAFLDIWLNSHTPVGLLTQSNFFYCQNIVSRVLTYGAPMLGCIVEERFPMPALTDPHAFYDSVGAPKKFEAHLARMMDSCARFIDFDKIDVLVTSAYQFGGSTDLAGQPKYVPTG